MDIRIARQTILDIGYTRAKYGFDGDTCAVLCSIDEKSWDIAAGVNQALETWALCFRIPGRGPGDDVQPACDETPSTCLCPSRWPTGSPVSRRVPKRTYDYLRPDGKSQVTIEYRDGKPYRADAVVLSTQHSPEADNATIERDMIEGVIRQVIPAELLDSNTRYLINPSGRFVIGGPQGDAGLTGRKIIVDTYGGYARHGGGAFSGKDPTKVDRSAAYAARYAAKNIVAAGLAKKCEIELAYAIGVARPVSVMVESFGTGGVGRAAGAAGAGGA